MQITYNEYLNYIGKLEETKNDYENLIGNLEPKKKVHHEHDKIIKRVLSNKKEAVDLINSTLSLKRQINEEDIEKYDKEFISQNFELREADIVYKLKEKDIYTIIEHQSKIDYSMAYRILNYKIELLRNTINTQKIQQKEYKIPLIIGILLYTGKGKWKAEQDIKDKEIIIDTNSGKYLGIQSFYALVDINNYSEQELLKQDTLLSKVMLIEKARGTKEIIRNLELIQNKFEIEETNGKNVKENKKEIERIINNILSKKIGQGETKKILEKFKGGEEDMAELAIFDTIDKEFERYKNEGRTAGIRTGRKEERLKIAKKLFEINMSLDEIKKVTGVTDKILKDIKEQH